jgi:hypothetical protein
MRLTLHSNSKTLWQMIYSFLGFWTYIERNGENPNKARKVIYWCCFPFFFIRKIDVFSYDVSKTHSLNAQKAALVKKMQAKGETIPKWLVA